MALCSAENHDVTDVFTVLSTVPPADVRLLWSSGSINEMITETRTCRRVRYLWQCQQANSFFFFFAYSDTFSDLSGNAAFHSTESVKLGSGRHHCRLIIRGLWAEFRLVFWYQFTIETTCLSAFGCLWLSTFWIVWKSAWMRWTKPYAWITEGKLLKIIFHDYLY